MRCLSVQQPWASLIASGRKTVEVRTWKTEHRGKLLIASARATSRLPGSETFPDGPRGVALCVVELVDVRPWEAGDEARALWRGHGYSWELRLLYLTRQDPIIGRLFLFEAPPVRRLRK